MSTSLVLFLVVTLVTLVALLFYKTYAHVVYALAYKITHNLKASDMVNYIYVFKEIYIDGDYEGALNVLKHGGVVFDVGGNQGLFALYLNDTLRDLTVHVFEPIPEIYEEAVHNIAANNKHNTFYVNRFGLSDKNEDKYINYLPSACGLSSVNDIEEKKEVIVASKCGSSIACRWFYKTVLIPRLNDVQQRLITLRRMSDYITSMGISKIDVVKIDVEGYELEVLKGIRDDHFKIIKSFLIEVENYRKGLLQAVVNMLRSHGFDIVVKDADKRWCMVVARR